MSSDKKEPKTEPLVDEYGYAGPWGDAKPGDVMPGVSRDRAERQREVDRWEEVQLQHDIIGNQIAEISAQLGEAWDRGDEALAEKLIEEQNRLMDLRKSIK